MKATYKEFSKYLRAVANLYAKYGDAPLEVEKDLSSTYKCNFLGADNKQ